jgi:hypothetical protein
LFFSGGPPIRLNCAMFVGWAGNAPLNQPKTLRHPERNRRWSEEPALSLSKGPAVSFVQYRHVAPLNLSPTLVILNVTNRVPHSSRRLGWVYSVVAKRQPFLSILTISIRLAVGDCLLTRHSRQGFVISTGAADPRSGEICCTYSSSTGA